MQKLLVYQSLWAMERRRPDGLEWTLPEKLEMIRDAGFDGCGVRFFDFDYARTVTDFLRAHQMTWQAQCYPRTVDDLKPILNHVRELGADHINLQPDVIFFLTDAADPPMLALMKTLVSGISVPQTWFAPRLVSASAAPMPPICSG